MQNTFSGAHSTTTPWLLSDASNAFSHDMRGRCLDHPGRYKGGGPGLCPQEKGELLFPKVRLEVLRKEVSKS